MKYLESRNEEDELKRASLAHAVPWARSVVLCAVNYNADAPRSTHAGSPSQGWISRYAWTKRDYHDVVFAKLRSLESRLMEICAQQGEAAPRTWCYVDTGPVIERVVAKYAGIGWIGKNTCVINPEIGSWTFLAAIICSLPLAVDAPSLDQCGTCTLCIEACPTQAIVGPGVLDSTRCISYLTIELRGDLTAASRAALGSHVYGCDICQEVCPWNASAPRSADPAWQPRPAWDRVDLLTLAHRTDDELEAALRGSPMRRTKAQGLRRNVGVALENAALNGCATPTVQSAARAGHATSAASGAGLQPCDAGTNAETSTEERR
jgi:epoxyqueuosine reductase